MPHVWPGFFLQPLKHIVVSVVSVVSVVRKKFIGQLQFYGNLPYKCSIQKKRQIQLFVRDRMNSIGPMNFFRTTDTTDTTDTTIWKPGFNQNLCWVCSAVIVSKALSHKVEFLIPRLNERSLPEPFTFFCYSDGNFKIMQTTLLWYIIIN